MRRLKLDAADLTPSEIAAKIRRVSTAKASQAKGVHGEELVRRALVATGYCMVERIATPAKLARGRLVYSARVSGDFRAVLPLRVRLGPANGAERDFGVSVLVECKARDVSLTWTAFEEHQRRALDEHAKLGGVSLVGWVQRGRVRLLDWAAIRAAGFGPGRSVMWDLNATTWRVRWPLPFDRARCHGLECEDRATCLRYLALDNMGPATPQYDTMAFGPGMCDARIGNG